MLHPQLTPQPASPEVLWEQAERRAEAGDPRGEAEALREGHRAGWPGFLFGLVSRVPKEATAAELSELAAEPLPLSRLTAARALAAQPEGEWLVELGMDLAVDPEGEAHLIEVNSRPALRLLTLARAHAGLTEAQHLAAYARPLLQVQGEN